MAKSFIDIENAGRYYAIEPRGIVPLELDETGSAYWESLVPHIQYLSPEEQEELEFTYRFTYTAHNLYSIDDKDRFRKDGVTPTIAHLEEVTRIGASYQLDLQSLQVLLTHDIDEDTLFTLKTLETLFGTEVAQDVDLLTNIRRKTKGELGRREDEAATALKKFIALSSKQYRVVLGKLIDRLTSMRSLTALSIPSRERNALETRSTYVALAEKSGHSELADELAQLSDQVLEPLLAEKAANLQSEALVKNTQYTNRLTTILQNDIAQGTCNLISHTPRYTHCYENVAEVDNAPGIYQYSITVQDPEDYEAMHNKLRAIMELIGTTYINEIRPGEISFKSDSVEITLMTHDVYDEKSVRIADVLRSDYDPLSSEGARKRMLINRKLSSVSAIITNYIQAQTMAEGLSATDTLAALNVEMAHPHFMTVLSKDSESIVLPIGATGLDFAAKIHSDYVRHGVGLRINDCRDIVPLSSLLNPHDKIELVMPDKKCPWNYTYSDYEQAATEHAKLIMRHDLQKCIPAVMDHYRLQKPLASMSPFKERTYSLGPAELESFAFNNFSTMAERGHELFVDLHIQPHTYPHALPLSRIWNESMSVYLSETNAVQTRKYPSYEVFAAYFSLGLADKNVIEAFVGRINDFANSIEATEFTVPDKAGGLVSVLDYARKADQQVIGVALNYPPDPTIITHRKRPPASALITVYTEPAVGLS